jgi:hypothetical protein
VPRRVIGIYVGWRGLSHTKEPWKELTFWGRKQVAESIGRSTDAAQLFTRLTSLQQQLHQRERSHGTIYAGSRLIFIGHSFGAALLYSAAGVPLTEHAFETSYDAKKQCWSGVIPSFGDLTVLINPAFQAVPYETLDRVSRLCFSTQQLPRLLVVTSRTDLATRYAFTAGQTLGQILQFSGALRSKDQEAAVLGAVGHFARYRTHTLSTNGNDVESSMRQSLLKIVRTAPEAGSPANGCSS